jgi:hypothetical protein
MYVQSIAVENGEEPGTTPDRYDEARDAMYDER